MRFAHAAGHHHPRKAVDRFTSRNGVHGSLTWFPGGRGRTRFCKVIFSDLWCSCPAPEIQEYKRCMTSCSIPGSMTSFLRVWRCWKVCLSFRDRTQHAVCSTCFNLKRKIKQSGSIEVLRGGKWFRRVPTFVRDLWFAFEDQPRIFRPAPLHTKTAKCHLIRPTSARPLEFVLQAPLEHVRNRIRPKWRLNSNTWST